jgi:protein SCO1
MSPLGHERVCIPQIRVETCYDGSSTLGLWTKPMRRREFILSLVSGVISWSLATSPRHAKAQIAFPPEGSKLTFTLTETDGTAVTEQNYRGKWLVIYFGYTFCPDVCPTTMMQIAGALKALGPRADVVQGLFITVDPQRDTPGVLNEYLKSFDPRLVGLTGTPAQIAATARIFHVFYERQDTDGGNYSYDHSAFIYLVDPDGKFAKAITSEGGSKQIADAVSALMEARR